MNIPLMNLKRQYESIKPEINAAINNVLIDGKYIMGEAVKTFESHFAEFSKSNHCIGVGNGTDAITISLKAVGVESGDHVFLPANTFFATAEAVANMAAIPVLVDVDSEHLLLDCDLLEKAISRHKESGKKLGAIIPVHLYGNVCDMERISEIAKKYGMKVIEDAAQAHGASFKGQPIASLSDAATFSFYPGKNLGAYGDAGAIITNDAGVAKNCEKLRNHGRKVGAKYDHDAIGFNSRLDTMQAAILDVKLSHLRDWTQQRQKTAVTYTDGLIGITGLKLVPPLPQAEHVYHLFVVRCEDRDGLRNFLQENGISTGIHYPISLSRISAMQQYLEDGISFPVSEESAEKVLSLPMCPDLAEDEIQRIIEKVKNFFNQ